MKDYEKLWNQLKIILSNDDTRYARRIIKTMERLEEVQPIAVFRKHIEGEWRYAPKGISKWFKWK